jgi:hypothetical protein
LKTPRQIVGMFKQRCLVVNAVNKVLTGAHNLLEGQEHLYDFYGNTTDLYTKGLERGLVLLW